jgi:hypothetical protein
MYSFSLLEGSKQVNIVTGVFAQRLSALRSLFVLKHGVTRLIRIVLKISEIQLLVATETVLLAQY